mgnify:CR=1 FL=1
MLCYMEDTDPITGSPRTIVYELTITYPIMSDLPVSPPSSPREPEEGGDYIPEYDINIVDVIYNTPQSKIIFMYTAPQFSFTKYGKRRNISKNMRRMGRLKQPGGASCNQRR